jgi:hypothetical protein
VKARKLPGKRTRRRKEQEMSRGRSLEKWKMKTEIRRGKQRRRDCIGRGGESDENVTEDERSGTRSEGKVGHMDVIPVHGWNWKAALMALVLFSSTELSFFVFCFFFSLVACFVRGRTEGKEGEMKRRKKRKRDETDKI